MGLQEWKLKQEKRKQCLAIVCEAFAKMAKVGVTSVPARANSVHHHHLVNPDTVSQPHPITKLNKCQTWMRWALVART